MLVDGAGGVEQRDGLVGVAVADEVGGVGVLLLAER